MSQSSSHCTLQVSIAKQLKSTLGIEDSTKIGFLVHVSLPPIANVLLYAFEFVIDPTIQL